jgi:molybdopterin synthase catalytic subunit/molybdopterin converting factor small subunit
MDVTVRLFAVLRERAGTERLILHDLPEPLDVAGLKRALQERHAELGDLGHVRGVLGTRYVDDATPVEAGQELSLLPPVSGGAPDGPDADRALARGVFEIREEPLDPEEARRRVSHPSCGGCVVFTGTTRARNRARDVVRLDYEAFHEMAGAEMGRVYAECVERFGPGSGRDERGLRMLTQHRTGTVEVGEPSIVIAVASPHRDAAFAACRFLIDELKARVPLWKKELYADGHHWIGDRS